MVRPPRAGQQVPGQGPRAQQVPGQGPRAQQASGQGPRAQQVPGQGHRAQQVPGQGNQGQQGPGAQQVPGQGNQGQQGLGAQQVPGQQGHGPPPLIVIALTVQDIFFLMTFVLAVLQTIGEIPFTGNPGGFLRSFGHYAVTSTAGMREATVDLMIQQTIAALEKELHSTAANLAYVEGQEQKLNKIYYSYSVMQQKSAPNSTNHMTSFTAAIKRLFQEIREVDLHKQDLLTYQEWLQKSREQLAAAKKLSSKSKIEITGSDQNSNNQAKEEENPKDKKEKNAEEKARLWPLSMLVGYTALLIGFMIVRNIQNAIVQYFLCVCRDIMMCAMLSTVCYRAYVLASSGILKGAAVNAGAVVISGAIITWVMKLGGRDRIMSLIRRP